MDPHSCRFVFRNQSPGVIGRTRRKNNRGMSAYLRDFPGKLFSFEVLTTCIELKVLLAELSHSIGSAWQLPRPDPCIKSFLNHINHSLGCQQIELDLRITC